MNYQRKLKYYRDLYSFHEYQQIMKLIDNIDTYVNNILKMRLSDGMENALISGFIDQNEIAIKEAMGRLTLFGQDAEDNCNDKPKERFYKIIEDKDGCRDRCVGYVYIGPGKFYVESFGIVDPNGKLVKEDDVPYTDDDEVDLKDDFADDDEDENDENDDEESLADEDEEDEGDEEDEKDDLADDEEDGEDENDDEEEGSADDEEKDDLADDEKDEDDPALYLLRKLVRGINAILKELKL